MISCGKITILAEETNERAFSLYKKLGYNVDNIVYLLDPFNQIHLKRGRSTASFV